MSTEDAPSGPAPPPPPLPAGGKIVLRVIKKKKEIKVQLLSWLDAKTKSPSSRKMRCLSYE